MREDGPMVSVMACAWCTHRMHVDAPTNGAGARTLCPRCGRPMFPLTRPRVSSELPSAPSGEPSSPGAAIQT
jgi:hypothetical protein